MLDSLNILAPPSAIYAATSHGQADGYLSNAFDPERLITQARGILFDKDFDTFVGTGVSGIIGASVLASALNKNLLIVRKPGEASHSFEKVEGRLGLRWVFVDDLIASGETYMRVRSEIEVLPVTSRLVGAYIYGAYKGVSYWQDAV